MPYKDPELKRANDRAYYAAHRDERIAYQRQYEAAHPEQKRRYAQTHRERHREERRAAGRAYWRRTYVPHPRPKIERPPNYERQRAWLRSHPEVRLVAVHRRRARLVGASGSYTVSEWRTKVELLGGVCFYCRKARRDVVVGTEGLSRGGSNDIANILPACRSCNSRKHTRTADEFLAIVRAA